MKHIVKRAGHSEPFDPKKVYASVYASCLAVCVQAPEAETVADQVSKSVEKWLDDKHNVTSHQISRVVVNVLRYYNSDAAYLYEHHNDIS